MSYKTKDVLIMCQYFPPENISSATLPFDTAKHLVSKGLSVDVITGKSKIYNDNKKIKTKETIDGVNIKRIRYFWTKSKSKFLRIMSFITFNLSIYLRLFSFKKYKTIIVYSNPPILPKVAILSKKLFKNKVVFVSYDVYPDIAIKSGSIKENSFIAKRMARSNDKLFPKLDKVIALSSEMKNYIITNRDIDSKNVVSIPNWHEDLYDPTVKKRIKDRFRVSYFGNMGTMQDIQTILDAAKLLNNNKEIEFLFAGHGIKFEYLKDYINKNKLTNVITSEYLKGIDYENAVNNSDVFIVSLEPGISKLASPSKMSSYLMGGKPIISIMELDSDISKDVLKYKLGISINNGEFKKLAEDILNLYTNEEELSKMGDNSRRLYLKKYKPSINLEKYYTLIHDIIGGKNV